MPRGPLPGLGGHTVLGLVAATAAFTVMVLQTVPTLVPMPPEPRCVLHVLYTGAGEPVHMTVCH